MAFGLAGSTPYARRVWVPENAIEIDPKALLTVRAPANTAIYEMNKIELLSAALITAIQDEGVLDARERAIACTHVQSAALFANPRR